MSSPEQRRTDTAPENYRIMLSCYGFPHHQGWQHVDVFVHDEAGREVNWVHWPAEGLGIESADEAITRHEPLLRRTSEWVEQGTSPANKRWTAHAEWATPEHTETNKQQAEPGGHQR